MVVVPCSMRTLAAIRTGLSSDLITRAADVTIKEKRRLVLVTRETPLSPIHLENMLAVSRIEGVVVFPPVMGFHFRPGGVEDMVTQSVGRMVDLLGVGEAGGFQRWEGMKTKDSVCR
jgi:flavin prenyltransferase